MLGSLWCRLLLLLRFLVRREQVHGCGHVDRVLVVASRELVLELEPETPIPLAIRVSQEKDGQKLVFRPGSLIRRGEALPGLWVLVRLEHC